ncbi:MAG: D-alanyl-D-alanine carboxypeptidase/D-alanyl-D-alanine-endopeptidase [Myxococcales bacterium]|nr:D-alanyl-D-alanine carboxypeptidase/D-alanyl-D-alanine-endopeptidase [Myxococcales bacterium]
MRLPLQFVTPFLAALVLSATAASAPKKDDGREELRKALKELIERSPLKNARVSAQVVGLEDGAVVFGRGEDELLNPASNVKLVTAAAALCRLGLEYRFETELSTDPELKAGKARFLYVRGKGDPSITTERMHNLVTELFHAGLREVSGDIVIDESYFDQERLAPGYDQENSDRSYMAPTGAASLNWNAVGVYLRPGEKVGAKAVAEIEPPSDYFTLESTLLTGSRRHRRFSVVSRLDKDKLHQRIEVRGSVPNERGTWSVWKKIDLPPQYFGHTLKAMLQERGVRVKGGVKTGLVPPGAKLLMVLQSDTLDIVLKRMNKHSSNFVAEQLLKTLGAEGRGAPGSTQKGIEVVEEFLEKEVGLPRGSYVMKNGSGLNDTNRFSASQLNQLLRHMYNRFPLAPEYLSALGVAGKDGTLKYRFEGSEAAGRLRAKTGTLENVSALSGYVQALGGAKFAFSVLVNDFPGRAGTVIQHIDALGAAIAATGSEKGPHHAVAQMTAAPSEVAPLEAVKARVKTYLALGRQADRRNIPFLRTALRNERDPAVRAVVADSLFQSDPQDYLGWRALVDSFSAGDEVYGRLRVVARELQVEVPGVSSVVELAAAGNLDALGRLLELPRAAAEDEAERDQLAVSLAEVARTAPMELLLALRAAQGPDRDAATALLAKGLVKEADPEQPFWPALKSTLGGLDLGLAAFARQVEEALSMRIAEEKAPKPPDSPALGQPSGPKPSSAEARPGG